MKVMEFNSDSEFQNVFNMANDLDDTKKIPQIKSFYSCDCQSSSKQIA